jgi:hypothetical protein
MRPFRLTALVMGAALSVSVAPFARNPVLADSVELLPVVPGNGDPVCGPDDIAVGLKPSAMSEGVCPEHATETNETARARSYLIETATPGYTMTRQGPELAIGRLHPEFVKRLAAAIKETRGAGLPFAGIFSAYRPPAFGVGGFADKFHSLHTYGLAVDVTGIGPPGTPSALLWHEIAARHGVICPYGPHNPVEWNHCQPTWVKIILPDNPLRETVTADGPISLEDMFEVGYLLIAGSVSVGGSSTSDPTGHFLKQTQARTAMDVDPHAKIASNRTTPKTALSILDGYTLGWPPLTGGKVGWPKGVPRIAKLNDETRRPNSLPVSPKLISIPRVLAVSGVGGSVTGDVHKIVERLRQTRSKLAGPNGAELAKTCRALAIKAHPTQRAGSKTAQRDYFQDCVANRPQKLANRPDQLWQDGRGGASLAGR